MLTGLHLDNFRGFERHDLPIRPLTIAVGRNNAGKSTVIEALRLIAIVTQRLDHLSYHNPPRWADLPRRMYGASVDISNLQIDSDTICYEYHDPPAVIDASFDNKCSIRVIIGGEKKIHAVVLDSDGQPAKSRSEARSLKIPTVAILPQIGPLAREEVILNMEYVMGAVDSPLSSSHFRNQLRIWQVLFPEFQRVAEQTWSGLQIRDLDYGRGYPGDSILLNVRNDEFVGEVSKMGHGLQMWLQCIWFLVRSQNASTLILDEPDVYMHADLQRRLIRYLQAMKRQIFVATHSVEMISEVEPQDILIIERKKRHSRFADSIPAVQRVIERVGSTQNIHLARLWGARRFLLLEGKDIGILKRLHNTLLPDSALSLEATPSMSIGGWGGWNTAIGSSLAMRNAFGESVHCYCILDRDYHPDVEIEERLREAATKGVQLHIWRRKEIENYLLVPAAIVRLITQQQPSARIRVDEVQIALREFAEQMKDEATDAIADELSRREPKLRAGGASKRARQIVENKRCGERGLIDVVSGKTLLSQMSGWSQNNYRVNLSAVLIAKSLQRGEINSEVSAVLRSIERLENFRQNLPDLESA